MEITENGLPVIGGNDVKFFELRQGEQFRGIQNMKYRNK